MKVIKTSCRTVVSLNYSKFIAKQVIRQEPVNVLTKEESKTSLSIIVASGSRYAYDIISEAGTKSFLEGRKLLDIKMKLENQGPRVSIQFSSLYDQQRKFLFYLGAMHHQASPLIKEYIHASGKVTWLIDGTLEPGTDVFFGIKDARFRIMLDCWKISTENEKDISRCLLEAGERFGPPDEILHDLSSTMQKACKIAYPNKPNRVCQFHFT